MSDTEKLMWATVYAAVIGGLSANHACRQAWGDMRERATIEANLAIIESRSKGVL